MTLPDVEIINTTSCVKLIQTQLDSYMDGCMRLYMYNIVPTWALQSGAPEVQLHFTSTTVVKSHENNTCSVFMLQACLSYPFSNRFMPVSSAECKSHRYVTHSHKTCRKSPEHFMRYRPINMSQINKKSKTKKFLREILTFHIQVKF